jgi:hypothetical protein
MDASERFLRFAAECELMAKFSPSPKNKTVWRRMAERWVRCAELVERQYSLCRKSLLNPIARGLPMLLH